MTAPDGKPPDRRYPGSPVLWRLAVLGTSIFYRIDRVGPPLPEGPVLLVANHPNTVLDPAVIQGTATRPVRFLAKSTLFERHVLSPFVRRSGAIPVYRRIDPGVDTSRNVETFAAVERALAEGDAICLFPEGISHVSGRLEPLRTGAARMALAAAAAGRPVAIVPVGLNFDRLPMFRSRMTALYGRPFDAGDLVDGPGGEGRCRARRYHPEDRRAPGVRTPRDAIAAFAVLRDLSKPIEVALQRGGQRRVVSLSFGPVPKKAPDSPASREMLGDCPHPGPAGLPRPASGVPGVQLQSGGQRHADRAELARHQPAYRGGPAGMRSFTPPTGREAQRSSHPPISGIWRCSRSAVCRRAVSFRICGERCGTMERSTPWAPIWPGKRCASSIRAG